jgi:23S rRNA (guanine2445-N2)-methyltransferase / 23S rRNA (guanine2069-N7)-methyltransferase
MYVATCAAGFEPILTNELSSFGAEAQPGPKGAVPFWGALETAYRACLWSRVATRILLPVAEYPASDPDSLYEGARDVEWEEHLAPEGSFSVEVSSSGSPIQHTRYALLRVKDGVADHFRERYQVRPSVDVGKPDVRIHVFLNKETAFLSLDLSGESLHRRGYRLSKAEAPLKETLAAAILYLSGWAREAGPETPLLDPMCGSGTILIEAALLYGDWAPGLGRDYFGFFEWRGHDSGLWADLVKEALSRKEARLKTAWPRIVGYDADRAAVRAAVENIERAGLTGLVHVERRELAHLEKPPKGRGGNEIETGFVISNPPYGERMGSLDAARYLYRCLGRKIKEACEGWRAAILSSRAGAADELGMIPDERYRLYNGPLPCELRVFNVPRGDRAKALSGVHAQASPRSSPHGSDAFSNRVRKNLKLLSGWADQESISCFRIYDADIPEFNVAVDLYENRVHVSEYAPPRSVDPVRAKERFKEVLGSLKDVLGLRREELFIKTRQKQKGKFQYQKRGSAGRLFEVRERGCRFLVNLSDYLDTGLFLDQRTNRTMIREQAGGKRFLNLFAYTGAATVCAAMGGASASVSVDLSSVYLDWARSNLALNGFSENNHRLVRADCLDWLSRAGGRFDLIYLAPPTFSSSKKSKGDLDLQRDHVPLIEMAMKRLNRGGLLLFSTHFRRFKMNLEALSQFRMEDITPRTIPPDFKRNPRIHQTWRITHGGP